MNDGNRIVITGAGILASNGVGIDQFWANCFEGVSGIKPITLFDTRGYRCQLGGEISDFEPEQYLGSKGLRNLDRTTQLALVAAKQAIENARLVITNENRDDIGVVLGSTMGSVHSISEFDKEGLREGPRYVNPALFPNTVINSPASQIAIRFGLRGPNTTISTGFTASLDAIGYAVGMLRLRRAETLLVGGVEEFCLQIFLGFDKLGLLASTHNGTSSTFSPFSQAQRGTLLGEGAAFFILESLERAKSRGATIYAEIVSYATQFDPKCLYRFNPDASGLILAIRRGLEEARLKPPDIVDVSASANGLRAGDRMEVMALREVFGPNAQNLHVSALKGLVGESFSAGGALQLAAVVGMLFHQASLPTYLWQEATTNEGHSTNRTEMPVEHVLMNGYGPMGISSVLVLGRIQQN